MKEGCYTFKLFPGKTICNSEEDIVYEYGITCDDTLCARSKTCTVCNGEISSSCNSYSYLKKGAYKVCHKAVAKLSFSAGVISGIVIDVILVVSAVAAVLI